MAAHVTMQPSMASMQQDVDTMDIDIDMDVDIGTYEEEELLEDGEADPQPLPTPSNPLANSLIPAIYNEDPFEEPQPEKVHIRGVDDLHTRDIELFANEYFPTESPKYIQWIDDTSANIAYASSAVAVQALLSFILNPTTTDEIAASPFALRATKRLSTRPTSMLQVRIAKAGDRKKKGAKDASRYYLLNPDQDPSERMRREFQNGRGPRRGGETGDYQRRRFDEREHRRRRDNDAAEGGGASGGDFSASMYDDSPGPTTQVQNSTARGRDLFAKRNDRRPQRNRSASPGFAATNSDEIDISDDEHALRHSRGGNRFRDRSQPPRYSRQDPNPFPASNSSKELFPTGMGENGTSQGTLHSDKLDIFSNKGNSVANNAAAAKKLKNDLFPNSSPRSYHKRSGAIDAANEEDLSERFRQKSLNGTEQNRNTGKELFSDPSVRGGDPEFNIRGQANQGLTIKGSGGISIKGAANVKELFPNAYKKNNEGKELFVETIRKRVLNRADDYH